LSSGLKHRVCHIKDLQLDFAGWKVSEQCSYGKALKAVSVAV
jgi:hypothetical protein